MLTANSAGSMDAPKATISYRSSAGKQILVAFELLAGDPDSWSKALGQAHPGEASPLVDSSDMAMAA